MTAAGGPGSQPTGVARLPPPWLHDHPLPILTIGAGQMLHRVHRTGQGPIFFGPAPGNPPANRFDCISGRFGVLYLSEVFEAAFVETVLRNPQLRSVRWSAIEERSSCLASTDRDLRFVKMYDEGLAALGTDNAISTGPYPPCGAWSDALWDHRDRPDGIAYRSRHDPGLICMATFARDGLTFTAGPSTPLPEQAAAIAVLLDRYGKSIEIDIL